MSQTLTTFCCFIQKPNGQTVGFAAAADTDVARGTALLAALAAAVSYSTYIKDQVIAGPGGFDVVNTPITCAGHFRGAGRDVTWIYSQVPGLNNHACICPSSNTVWSDFTLHANNATVQQSPFGCIYTDLTFTNVVLKDAHIIGAVDGIHFTQNSNAVWSLRCERVIADSNFDCFTVSINSAGVGSRLELIDCEGNSTFPHPTFPYPSYVDTAHIGFNCRAVIVADADAIFDIAGGKYNAQGGASTNSAIDVIVAGATGTIRRGAYCTSSGTLAKDIKSTATTKIDQSVIADPAKLSGTTTAQKSILGVMLPTDDPAVVGALWNEANIVTVSGG